MYSMKAKVTLSSSFPDKNPTQYRSPAFGIQARGNLFEVTTSGFFVRRSMSAQQILSSTFSLACAGDQSGAIGVWNKATGRVFWASGGTRSCFCHFRGSIR